MTAEPNKGTDNQASERRELLVFHVGRHLLGIFAEDVAGVASGKSPASLPRAPEPVLGVIAFRGRMLTVIDLRLLLDQPAERADPSIIVALSGEEQLAIAADSSRGAIQVLPRDIEISPSEAGPAFLAGTISRDGDQIEIVDVSCLFRAATGQQERRRRRF